MNKPGGARKIAPRGTTIKGGEVPNVGSVETIYLVLAFIVPGLIASFVRAQFITGRTASHAEAALSYLTLSVVYYALALPAVDHALTLDEPGYRKALTWFALVFAGPSLFGLLLGLNAQKELTRRLLKRIGLNPVHVMPTAWDWKFGSMKEAWVLAVLKDGTKFAGFCGAGSFMSSDPKERDLYIQRVYELDENNIWHPRENGVLIAAGEIRTIEFWPYRKEISHDQQANIDARLPSVAAGHLAEGIPALGAGEASGRPPAGNGAGRAIEPAESGQRREEVVAGS
ncbi:MAG: DUF6338 family protein [Pseudorhodoplanes sp.]